MRWLPTAVYERRRADAQVDHLRTLATIDGLTGVYNRRYFLALAEAEWNRSRRYHRPLALLMIDIDHFKAVNDRYGHDVGDQVIAGVAKICMDGKRHSDVVGRMGGEEFAVLLPETSSAEAAVVAERLRIAVSMLVLPIGDPTPSVSISVGVSDARDASQIADFLKQADLALYEAKRTGRNRVALAKKSFALN